VSQLDIDVNVAPSGFGCVECEATGGWWFHLRRCAACGHIGCCDSSQSKHATAHWKATGHPVIRSFEPGEAWFYDYRTDGFVEGRLLAEPDCHPVSQTTPGPAERVPQNWAALLEAAS
jgi:ubiquitin-hydrolase Zn-finger-containing protein